MFTNVFQKDIKVVNHHEKPVVRGSIYTRWEFQFVLSGKRELMHSCCVKMPFKLVFLISWSIILIFLILWWHLLKKIRLIIHRCQGRSLHTYKKQTHTHTNNSAWRSCIKEIYDCNKHAMMQKVIVERVRIVALRLKEVWPDWYGTVPNAPEVQFGRHRTVPVAVNVLIMHCLSGV